MLFVGSLAGWLWTPFAAGFAQTWITHPICCVLNSLQYAILALLAWSTRSTPYCFRCGLFVAAAVGVEWLLSKVGLIQVHEKLSLVPIRESDSSFLINPIIQQFLGLPESAKLTSGTIFEVMSFTDSAGKTRKLAVSICYESWQPWLPQYHSNEKLDAICYLFYDGNFADYPVFVDRMLATIRMRAIETRTWQLVCSIWSGSAVIDPRGNIVKRLGPVQGVLRTDSF